MSQPTLRTSRLVLRPFRKDDASTVQLLAGAVSQRVDRGLNQANLGYWIGKPHWNLGYATEAARAVIAAGFGELGLNRIYAFHLARNPSSGRVMEKLGMLLEGTARQHTMKWGKYEDLVSYGILREA